MSSKAFTTNLSLSDFDVGSGGTNLEGFGSLRILPCERYDLRLNSSSSHCYLCLDTLTLFACLCVCCSTTEYIQCAGG